MRATKSTVRTTKFRILVVLRLPTFESNFATLFSLKYEGLFLKCKNFYFLQKQKLEALSKSRLPDDFLESISSAPVRSEPEKGTEAEKEEDAADRTSGLGEDLEEGSDGEKHFLFFF